MTIYVHEQTVILSGVSGSGKTFIAKQILHASVQYMTNHSSTARPAAEKLVQSALTVLEALGHCKSSLNNDSSRYCSAFEVSINIQLCILIYFQINILTYIYEVVL